MAADQDGAPRADGPSSLGGLLRALRERKLLTQEELAERSGLSVRTIRILEHDRISRPRSGSIRLLAEALGLDSRERETLVAAARTTRPAGRPSSSPAGPSRPTPRLLPPDVADFTGRVEQVRMLDTLTVGGQDGELTAVVISAIAGAAGVGKTALAVHWAHQASERFPDGQLHVNLDGYAHGPPLRPIQALSQLLRGLGVESDKVPVELEEAAALYRSLLAGKRMLVLLDNAHSADQVRPLLPASPGCVVVVTSRDRLTGLVATNGARRLTLDVLTLGEAIGLLGRILGEDRVAAEPQAAEKLARLCGHLPLALRIAAANLANHPEEPIADYTGRLHEGDLLAALEIDGDPQAAVRAAYDLSYRQLCPEAQRTFRLLGLVPGPDFPVAAAAALTSTTPEQAGRLVEQLAGMHLVEPRGPGRYTFHDLLRRYARERAEGDDQGERDAAVRRLMSWYMHTADAAAGLLYTHVLRLAIPPPTEELPPAGFTDAPAALGWLDAELPNLVAAANHAAGRGPRSVAWLLADALRGYFWMRGSTIDWLTMAHAGLTAATQENDSLAEAAVRLSLGTGYRIAGRDDAIEHFTTALELARRTGWVDGQAAALGNLGSIHHDQGRPAEAADHYALVLAIADQTGWLEGKATGLNNLGDVYRELGRLEEAAEHEGRAVALSRQLGSRSTEAIALGTLGEAERDLGRLGQASDHLDLALALAREVGDRYNEAYALNALAGVRRDSGRHAEALKLAEAALALAPKIGDRRCWAEILNTLGGVHLALGHHQQALEHHRQALGVARQIGARYPEADALIGLAVARQHAGRHLEAIDHARQALAVASQAGYQVLEGRAHTALATVLVTQGRHDEAADHARHALTLHRQTGHRLGQARALVVLGQALRQDDSPNAHLDCWWEALELLTDMGSPDAEQVRDLLRAEPTC